MNAKLVQVQLLVIVLAGSATAANLPTARQAVEIANKRLAPHNQNQVLQVVGRHSDSDLRIRDWSITFYDDTRVNNAVTVRVEDGQDAGAEAPLRMFQDGRWDHFDRNFTGFARGEIINLQRWKLDSDDVLKKVLKDPKLEGVQVTEVRMALRKLSDGDVPPVWRIWLRARSRTRPSRESWIGHVDVSAESGEVLANELHVAKLTR